MRIDRADKLYAEGGLDAVLLIRDKTADTVGDLVVGVDAGDIDLLDDEADVTEGKLLSVHRHLAVVVLDIEQLNTAHIRLVKARTLERTRIAVHSAGALEELGLLMPRAEGVVVRAKAVEIEGGYGTALGAGLVAEVGVADDEVDLRAVVDVVVKEGAFVKLVFHKRPAVYRHSVLVEIKARELIRRENVAVLGESTRLINGVV